MTAALRVPPTPPARPRHVAIEALGVRPRAAHGVAPQAAHAKVARAPGRAA
jgi:hypothetical protein